MLSTQSPIASLPLGLRPKGQSPSDVLPARPNGSECGGKTVFERQVIPQLDPDSEDTLTGGEEASSEEELVQEEVALEEREPDIQSPESQSENSANEQYQRPVRERRAPRVFTYDQLGNPGCYSTVCPSNAMYWYLPTHYGTMQATHGWPTPIQHANFQPAVPWY